MTILAIAQLTEDEARKRLESLRWPSGPVCPHCNDAERIYPLLGKSHRKGLYKCGACRKQFTVTVGTVMHRSRVPLRKWVLAFHLMCSSKKGISALQLQRNLGLGSYQTAWHMAHRIRAAMREEPMAGLLRGTVEVDETYVGGKSRKGKPGRGSERKTPVVALIERGGRARSHTVDRVNARALKGAIREEVDRGARIITDEWAAYRGIGREFAGGHETVCHSRGEYARGDVNSNSAESYFALLKRGVHGTFHSVSRKHLNLYCGEFSFRWSQRKVTDEERAEAAMGAVGGKRLSYKDLVKAQ